MNTEVQRLEFIELEAMDALNNTDDFVRGFAVGVIIGILALT
ncbi:MpaA2 family daptide-type RiPP [Microbacterium paraoxydans]|nr:MpaA2 family daptide-type RiPP [Microbacterium paraoxydans]